MYLQQCFKTFGLDRSYGAAPKTRGEVQMHILKSLHVCWTKFILYLNWKENTKIYRYIGSISVPRQLSRTYPSPTQQQSTDNKFGSILG